MKIIGVDNFARESVADVLVCENVNAYYGERIVAFLNNEWGNYESDTYYKLVDDDHRLWGGMAELV